MYEGHYFVSTLLDVGAGLACICLCLSLCYVAQDAPSPHPLTLHTNLPSSNLILKHVRVQYSAEVHCLHYKNIVQVLRVLREAGAEKYKPVFGKKNITFKELSYADDKILLQVSY